MDNMVIVQLVIILVLTMINAFFAASEIAVVSSDKNRLRMKAEDGSKKAQKLLGLMEKPSRFLSTIQVGITFAGFFSSASAAVGLSDDFGRVLSVIGVPFPEKLAFVLVTIMLSFVVLVFGELVPKRVALQAPEKFAMTAVGPIIFVSKVMSPFVSLLSITTNSVIRLFGIKTDGVEERITLEEIMAIVEVGEEQGVIEETEKEMIDSIMSFDDILAGEVRTPRTSVFMIDLDDEHSVNMEKLLRLGFSRVPVYRGTPDNMLGVLNMRDLMKEAYANGFDDVNIESLLSEPFFVHENRNINDLFHDMRKRRNHMALLVDGSGGFEGVVTMEDLIEEIVGEIEDEFDQEKPMMTMTGKDSLECDGAVLLSEVTERLESDFDMESFDKETVSGFILRNLSSMPSEEETPSVIHDGLLFEVLVMGKRRVLSAKVTKNR